MRTLLLVLLAPSCAPHVITWSCAKKHLIGRTCTPLLEETVKPAGLESQILAWMSSDEGTAALKAADEDNSDPWREGELASEDVVFNEAAPQHARPLPAKQTDESDFEARGLREEAYLGRGLALKATNPTRAAQIVRKQGVARLDGVLSESTANALHDLVLKDLARLRAESAAAAASSDNGAFQLVSVGSGTQRLSDGSSRETRWDVRLSRDTPVVAQALHELLGSGAPLGRAIEALGGRKAQLWELAAIVSTGGAKPQIVHADAMWSPDPLLLTAFIALQPVTRQMGPTRFLPRTHTGPRPASIVAKADATKLRGQTSKGDADGHVAKPPLSWVGLLGTGDAALYDGRLLHCGGANRSGKHRVLLYVTFRAADAAEAGGGAGCTLAELL